ncbi:MAG: preprotein translocase subunit SecG [Sphingobacteriales bacterium]|nr:MAG: preprotein translocase subunit SecG [Sphingobacteriales bacterium]TAF78973.1 MAG: preprotein translocase subunit SecG [Sphingobacteriales bacterium]
MTTFLIIITVLVCIVLILTVLIQNPKGGGLSSGLSSSNNIMGVQRTGDILEKGSWILAITIMLLAVIINITVPKTGEGEKKESIIQEQIDKTATPSNLPTLPGGNTTDSTKK